MPRKDIYHEAVRTALEKDGWTITDDPLTVPLPLYLAIPQNEYTRLEKVEIYQISWKEFQVNLLIFDENKKKIEAWISN